jgi:hypothetical protein
MHFRRARGQYIFKIMNLDLAVPKGAANAHVSVDLQVWTLPEHRRAICDVRFVFVTL